MARPKEFEEEAALEKAMCLFWEQGYEATCMQGLVEATGLSRSSLYETFVDKRTLYLAALEHYVSKMGGHLQQTLSVPGPKREAIRGLFQQMIELSLSGEKRGCMVVGCIAASRFEEADVRAIIEKQLATMEIAFHDALQEGVGRQEFAPGIRLNEVAKYLVNSYLGFALLCKVVHDRTALESIVQTTLSILD